MAMMVGSGCIEEGASSCASHSCSTCSTWESCESLKASSSVVVLDACELTCVTFKFVKGFGSSCVAGGVGTL
eukprot:6585012-Ditylum_brightwellii.AAC.1